MTCSQFAGSLIDAFEPGDFEALRGHADGCPSCRRELEAHLNLVRGLVTAAPAPLPPGFAMRVRRAAERAGAPSRCGGPARLLQALLPRLTVAATVLAGAAGAYLYFNLGKETPAAGPERRVPALAASVIPGLRVTAPGAVPPGSAIPAGATLEFSPAETAAADPFGSRAALALAGSGKLEIFRGSRLRTTATGIFVERGLVSLAVPPGSGGYRVEFDGGSATVKGTRFMVHVIPGVEAGVTVLEGSVVFAQGAAEREVAAGFRSVAKAGGAGPGGPIALLPRARAAPNQGPGGVPAAGPGYPEPYRELIVQYLKGLAEGRPSHPEENP